MPVWKFPFEVFTIDMNLRGIFEGNFLPGWVLLLWIVTMGTANESNPNSSTADYQN